MVVDDSTAFPLSGEMVAIATPTVSSIAALSPSTVMVRFTWTSLSPPTMREAG